MTPVPVDSIQPWATNIVYVIGALGASTAAILTAFGVRRKEAAIDRGGEGIVALAGTLQDGKALNRLTEQLSENGRSMRDVERSNRDVERAVTELCRTLALGNDRLDDALRFMQDRDKRERSEEARMMRIIDASRGG